MSEPLNLAVYVSLTMPSLKTDFYKYLKYITIKFSVMPIKKTTNKISNHEIILKGMEAYTKGKKYKQVASRAFLAGAKHYKTHVSN